jgi:hypothetical protein
MDGAEVSHGSQGLWARQHSFMGQIVPVCFWTGALARLSQIMVGPDCDEPWARLEVHVHYVLGLNKPKVATMGQRIVLMGLLGWARLVWARLWACWARRKVQIRLCGPTHDDWTWGRLPLWQLWRMF